MKKLIFLLIIVSFFQQINAQQKGNNCVTAISYAINIDPIGGVINNGETWWYVFTLSGNYQDVEIRTCNSTATASCIVDLYSDCSTFITGGANDCNPGNPNEMISLTSLNAGTYYVKITGGETSNGAFSLEIIGTTDVVFDDLSVTNITKPVKNFTSEMPVTITIENFGTNSQTGFPVSYTFNGNTVTETYTEIIESGQTAEYTFLQTIDLSSEAIHDISAKTELSSDENSANDEFSSQINTYVNPNTLSFAGDDYVSIPNDSALNFTGDFTIETWFYVSSSSSIGKVISKHNNDGTRSGYAIEYDGTNIKTVIGIGGGWSTVSASINTDQWYHIAMVYDSTGTQEMYLDGVSQGTANGTMINNDLDLWIGSSQHYGQPFTGYIEELRIWNEARTETEIQDNMYLEINPQSANLLAYYDFNRGISEGNNTAIEYLPDMTDNNFHGKMNNFSLQGGIDGNFFQDCSLDISKPTITCIENQEVNLLEGETVYTVDGTEFDPIATSDNCGVASIVNDFNNTETLAGAELPEGTTTIIWTVTDNAGNENTCSFEIIVNTYVGIENIFENTIGIYPNPFSDNIIIDKKNNSEKIRFEIINTTGQIIYQGEVIDKTIINTSSFTPGVYIIKLENDNTFEFKRLIKQ